MGLFTAYCDRRTRRCRATSSRLWFGRGGKGLSTSTLDDAGVSDCVASFSVATAQRTNMGHATEFLMSAATGAQRESRGFPKNRLEVCPEKIGGGTFFKTCRFLRAFQRFRNVGKNVTQQGLSGERLLTSDMCSFWRLRGSTNLNFFFHPHLPHTPLPVGPRGAHCRRVGAHFTPPATVTGNHSTT